MFGRGGPAKTVTLRLVLTASLVAVRVKMVGAFTVMALLPMPAVLSAAALMPPGLSTSVS